MLYTIYTISKKTMFKNHTKPSDYFNNLNLHSLCNILNEFIEDDSYDDWNYLSQISDDIYQHIDFLIKSDDHTNLTTSNQVCLDDLYLTKEIIAFILHAKVSGHKTSQLISQTIDDHEDEPTSNLGNQLNIKYLSVGRFV